MPGFGGVSAYRLARSRCRPQAPLQTPESRITVPYTFAVAMLALIWPDGSRCLILSLIWVN